MRSVCSHYIWSMDGYKGDLTTSHSIRPLFLCLGYSWFQGENISRFTLWRWSKLRLHISFCLFWEKQPPCKPGECCRIASALDVDIKSSPQWMSGSWCAKSGEWLQSRVTSGRSALQLPIVLPSYIVQTPGAEWTLHWAAGICITKWLSIMAVW